MFTGDIIVYFDSFQCIFLETGSCMCDAIYEKMQTKILSDYSSTTEIEAKTYRKLDRSSATMTFLFENCLDVRNQ